MNRSIALIAALPALAIGCGEDELNEAGARQVVEGYSAALAEGDAAAACGYVIEDSVPALGVGAGSGCEKNIKAIVAFGSPQAANATVKSVAANSDGATVTLERRNEELTLTPVDGEYKIDLGA